MLPDYCSIYVEKGAWFEESVKVFSFNKIFIIFSVSPNWHGNNLDVNFSIAFGPKMNELISPDVVVRTTIILTYLWKLFTRHEETSLIIWQINQWAGFYSLETLTINRFPTNIYLLKVKNRNTRKRCEICSVNNIHTRTTSDVVLVCILLTEHILQFLSLTLNIFHTFFHCFYCSTWTSKD